MVFLGIDFGTQSIGIARSDEGGRIALPIEIIKNDASLHEHIRELVEAHGISEIVIGESKDFHGRDNKIMKEARAFADELKRDLSLPVSFEPEFLTSAEARRLPEGGVGEGERGRVDASAAAIILQSFLDKRNQNSHE